MGKIENLARGPHELKRWRSPSFECRIKRRRRFSLCNRTSLSRVSVLSSVETTERDAVSWRTERDVRSREYQERECWSGILFIPIFWLNQLLSCTQNCWMISLNVSIDLFCYRFAWLLLQLKCFFHD